MCTKFNDCNFSPSICSYDYVFVVRHAVLLHLQSFPFSKLPSPQFYRQLKQLFIGWHTAKPQT